MIPPVNRRGRRRTGAWWLRKLRIGLTERVSLKLTSVLLAVVLWFIVSVREPAEQIVAVRFLPTLESGLTLAAAPPPVRALVRGSGRDILKLYSTPPAIRRNIGGDVADTVTIDLRPADIDLPPGVSAIVRDVQPRRLTLVFAPRRGRRPTGAGWVRPAARTDLTVPAVLP